MTEKVGLDDSFTLGCVTFVTLVTLRIAAVNFFRKVSMFFRKSCEQRAMRAARSALYILE